MMFADVVIKRVHNILDWLITVPKSQQQQTTSSVGIAIEQNIEINYSIEINHW